MVAYVTGRVVPIIKCMEYDRVNLVFLVGGKEFLLDIGYVEYNEGNKFSWKILVW